MTTDQLIANYTPAGDMITTIVSLVLLFIIFRVLYFSKDRKFIFVKRSLHFILVSAISNVIFYVVASRYGKYYVLLFILRDIYHLGLLCCLYCFMLYLKRMLDVKGRVVYFVTYMTRFTFLCCLTLDMLSPFTSMGLTLRDGKWHDSLISPFNFFYVYTLVILLCMLLFYSDRLIRSVRVCLMASETVVVIVMIFQIIWNTNTFSGFTYVIPVLVLMILLHSKPFDDKTGSLGLDSFENFVKQTSLKNISVDYIVLKLYISMLDRLPSELGKILNSFWHGSFKNAELFDLSSNLYVLAVPREEKNGDTEAKINELINNLFPQYYAQYNLPYKIIELFDIDFVENVSDVLGMLKFLLQNMEDNSCYIVDDDKKKQLQMYKSIRKHLTKIEADNDLDDPRVIVYCQPIRNMKTGKYDTGEALMRLSLPDIGFVMPGMFIEMAEQYEHIHTLTRIMLNKVCKQINILEKEGYKFERISVNFAASEIKADGFCDEILDIIKSNGVDPSKIGIELTETQTESDFMIVRKKIRKLRDAGMTLYLDDVGTGYSNLDRIVRYDVDVVKFDRFFLLEAEKNMKIIKMMSHLSQAFRDLDYKLLYEGVETDAHEALCMNCGADYIQGFKYSKPVPIEELRNFFERCDDTTDESDASGAQFNDDNELLSGGKASKLFAYDYSGKKAFDLLDPNDFSPEQRALVDEFNSRAEQGNLLYQKTCMDLVDAKEQQFERLEELQNQYGILLTMSKLFYSMHVIDLENNTVVPYNPTEDINVMNVVNSSVGADVMMRQIMRMCTVDEHVDDVLEFSELTTIADRMINKKILTAKYIGRSIGWYIAAFYTIEADNNGRPTKVVFTTRSIEDSII